MKAWRVLLFSAVFSLSLAACSQNEPKLQANRRDVEFEQSPL